MTSLLDRLCEKHSLSFDEWCTLLASEEMFREEARNRAEKLAVDHFKKQIFYRGIIEFSNYCKNDCYYCGLQKSNTTVSRFRLDPSEILEAAQKGYAVGVRTIVLQSGEDSAIHDSWLESLLEQLHHTFPDCALTLSLGERSKDSYARLFRAGATRYLLRHETANPLLYQKVHGPKQLFWHRINCLYALKDIGYQTGCGMIVGLPGQRIEDLACDFCFIQAFQPHMLGIGPFLPHHATPFAAEKAGRYEQCLYVLSLARLLLPRVHLPATTALRSQSKDGLSLGILSGCNVVMPSLTPPCQKKEYRLYDSPLDTKDIGERIQELSKAIEAIGYSLVCRKGDFA